MDLSVVPYAKSETTDTLQEHHTHTLDTKLLDKTFLFNSEPPAEPVVMKPKIATTNNTAAATAKFLKYRECMRNHAASIGGHANDGCGEFMPCGKDGTREALTCAACGCHRNFHRREVPGGGEQQHRHLMHSPTPPPPMLLYNAGPMVSKWDKKVTNTLSLMPQSFSRPHHRNGGGLMGAVDHHDDDLEGNYDRRSETPEREEMNVGPGGRAGRGKRHRTKFTQEQKDRMLEFAERIGWRIHKNDDVALNQFCLEVGVKRNVLKVWMHNNKNAHRRRDPPPQSPVVEVVAATPPLPPPQPVGV